MNDHPSYRPARMVPYEREYRMSDHAKVLGGRYELGRVIGRGGMARVSQARDLRLGRDVAVKELRLDLASDPTFQARFRREAQAAAGLNHPNIVSVYDTGEETDPASGVSVPFIVMELVEGRTLRDVLRDGRPILPRRALEFTQGVLDALDYSHKAGIIHRDIKPANVMLTATGTVKVMDFGIARAVSDTSSTMTQTAAVIGTAQYLSPEQARGEVVDARSDIYSAGCLLYELLVGRPPFQGDSPVSVAYQHVRENPVPPSQLDAEITAPMDAVVLKALAKNPDDRYQTAAEMRDDIGRILDGQQVHASLAATAPLAAAVAPTSVLPVDATASQPTPGTVELEAVPDAPRSRAGLWWTFGIIALLLAGLVIGYYAMRSSEPRVTMVAVPAGLFGQPQSVAEAAIREVGLEPVVTTVSGTDDDTVGKVIAVQPAPSTEVAQGSQVTITINAGPERANIPSGLVGQSVSAAEATLRAAGFDNVRKVAATDEPADATANAVLSVSPDEGSSSALTATVTLTYATGKARVPYLIGMSLGDARAEAAKSGFTNLSVETQESDNEPGTVIATRPLSNTLIGKTDPLVIIVSAENQSPTTRPTDDDDEDDGDRSPRPTRTP